MNQKHNKSMGSVCQGDQDKKMILPTTKHEVEDATPGQGKNTKVVSLPCIWGIMLDISLRVVARDMSIKNWGARVIGTCHSPRARSTTRCLEGTGAWGQTLVVARRGKPKLRYSRKAACGFWWGSRKNGLLSTGSFLINLTGSKPLRSWPTRALDIVGKLIL